MPRLLTRALSLAALTLTLTTAVAQASPAWTSHGVNFRAGPGTWHPVLAHLPRCAAIEVSRYADGWAYANWQGTWGWVAQGYVRASNQHCGRYGHSSRSYGHGGGYVRSY